jgi:hypothetical protein
MNLRVNIFLLLIIYLLFAGCLQPDTPVEERFELEILKNGELVSVIDIDPFTEEILYIYDRLTGVQVLNVEFHSDTNTIRIQRESDGGIKLTGIRPSGMGIVTFRYGNKTAELRIFIRNWNINEVYRHTLYADTKNYPFCPDTEYFASHYNSLPGVPNEWAAYQLIVDRGFHYEAPDGLSSRVRRSNNGRGLTQVHEDFPRETANRKVCPQPHIFQRPDPFLNRDVFVFCLHYETDGDMVGGFEDRQRLELKTMDTGRAYNATDDEPDNFMYSTGGGDTFTYRWKFFLPEDFRVSPEYTHIHQIKPEGGDSGNPTITLTGRRLRATGQEVLQLIYRGPIRDNGDPSVNWYPAQVPLAPFKGEWIRAETTITFDNPGTYMIRLVRIRDMRILMEYIHSPENYEELDPFVMFRNGNSYIRPKFGIYRRIQHMTPFGLPDPSNPVLDFLGENNEMEVLFADFEMDKLRR